MLYKMLHRKINSHHQMLPDVMICQIIGKLKTNFKLVDGVLHHLHEISLLQLIIDVFHLNQAMLPHDSGGHSTEDRHDHSSHIDSEANSRAGHTQEGVWLGLVALGGIYFFFLTERLMGIISKWRTNVRKKKKVMYSIISFEHFINNILRMQ